jgi:hypothetical protein
MTHRHMSYAEWATHGGPTRKQHRHPHVYDAKPEDCVFRVWWCGDTEERLRHT